MAKYRHVHTSFWQDPRVMEEMTPEDKYFYLYLLTNPSTTQIGVYQITKKQMAFDLGYSQESVKVLLDRFIKIHGMVRYNEKTREIAILNWGKYNLNKSGKPMMDCLEKEIKEVKSIELLREIMLHIANTEVLALFERYVPRVVDESLTTSGQKEKEKEKENTNNDSEQSPPVSDFLPELNDEEKPRPDLSLFKGKNIKEVDSSRGADSPEVRRTRLLEIFEKWWKLYDKKVDKQEAKEIFLKLKDADIEAMRKHTPQYVKATEKKFRKDPKRYLSKKTWQNEIIATEAPKEIQAKKPVRLTQQDIDQMYE